MTARRRTRAIALAGVLVTLTASACSLGGPPVCDGVDHRAVRILDEFTGWLQRNGAEGFVGEVGWPSGADSAQWNHVAEDWFAHADAAGLWVTTWSASEWWPPDYRMAIWSGPNGFDRTGDQAPVVKEHLGSPGGALRGVAVPSGAFGTGSVTGSYSNRAPGRYGTDYQYESGRALRSLADAGVRVVRLAVAWERLQPDLRRPPSPQAIAQLRDVVRRAHAAGLQVIIDLHNEGEYRDASGGRTVVRRLGPGGLDGDLVRFWVQLSAALGGEPGLLGYGLMNEPHTTGDGTAGARAWEAVSQSVVTALRGNGDAHTVFVSGYRDAFAGDWSAVHPTAWIDDPADAVRYETHQYFDKDNSGRYTRSYGQELAAADSVDARSCGR